jgi:hypothetical protein
VALPGGILWSHQRKGPRAPTPGRKLSLRFIFASGFTCCGDLGIGYGKIDFLIAEHGRGDRVMRANWLNSNKGTKSDMGFA